MGSIDAVVVGCVIDVPFAVEKMQFRCPDVARVGAGCRWCPDGYGATRTQAAHGRCFIDAKVISRRMHHVIEPIFVGHPRIGSGCQ